MAQRYTWPNPTKSGSLKCYLPLTISMQKIKDINRFFTILLLVKESLNLIEWDTMGQTQPKHHSHRCYLPLMTISTQKKTKGTWFFPDIDDQRILQSDWMRGTPGYIQLSGSLRCYLPLMIISMQKDRLIPSGVIDDQGILQSGRM